MPADWQSYLAVAILAVAVAFVLHRGWRALRARGGCACSGGPCAATASDRLPKRHELLPLNIQRPAADDAASPNSRSSADA